MELVNVLPRCAISIAVSRSGRPFVPLVPLCTALAAPSLASPPAVLRPLVFRRLYCLCRVTVRRPTEHPTTSSSYAASHRGLGRFLSPQLVMGEARFSLRRHLSIPLGRAG